MKRDAARLLHRKQIMRIAHVIDYLADSDGHAAVCLRLAAEQARRGHDCGIVTCRAPADVSRLQPPGVLLRVLASGHMPGPGGGMTWPQRGAVAAFLQEWRPTIIHLHGFWDCTILSAASAARRAGVPVVLSPHGVLAPWVLRRHRLFKRLVWHLHARRCLHDVAALHATSVSEADDIRGWGFQRPAVVMPLGVDLPASSPAAGAGTPASPRPAADARRIALFLSRLHPKKGLPLLLRAWAAVRPAGWRLVIAGPGSPHDIAVVQSLCEALHLTADVQLAGEVCGAARDRLYRTADLFVLPSYTENFGLVVAEALAYGLPVITTRGTPWSELVAQQCGWWVGAEETALGCALREATQLSDEGRRTMGARGRSWVRACFTWDVCASQVLSLYEQLGPKSAHSGRTMGVFPAGAACRAGTSSAKHP